ARTTPRRKHRPHAAQGHPPLGEEDRKAWKAMKKTTKRRSRSRRSRRGNAGAPKTRPGIPHHYEAADVLAGAYGRGSRMREDQTFLVHTAVCNVRGGILHALCKRIPV